MSSAQWDLQDNLLPDAFQALSATRQSLKVNLFAPCPEPEPEIDPGSGSSPSFSKLKTRSPKLLIRPTPRLTQALDLDSGGLTRSGPEQPFARPKNDRQPPTDNRPKNRRETGRRNEREISAKNVCP